MHEAGERWLCREPCRVATEGSQASRLGAEPGQLPAVLSSRVQRGLSVLQVFFVIRLPSQSAANSCLPLLTPTLIPCDLMDGRDAFSPARTSTWSSHHCEEPSGPPCACWWSCTPRARITAHTCNECKHHGDLAGIAPCVRWVLWRRAGDSSVPERAVQRWCWPEGSLRGQEDQKRLPGGAWCQI